VDSIRGPDEGNTGGKAERQAEQDTVAGGRVYSRGFTAEIAEDAEKTREILVSPTRKF
jgi:hypothetical protein